MKKIRVMIVDDSIISRQLLEYIISSDESLEVVAQVDSAEKALEMLPEIKPDVLTVDIHLPNMNGYEFTRRVMSESPVPIVIISGLPSANCFQAMELGALALLPKPEGVSGLNFQQESAEIIRQIKIASEVKLVTRKLPQKSKGASYQAVAIGGSLGGPQALQKIFSQLPASFPLPIFVVQHISPGFIPGMVTWLQQTTQMRVTLGKHLEKVLPGNIYIAPDHANMTLNKGGIIELKDQGSQPSVNSLFKSMSETYKGLGVGVILTGMGRDGAEGLLEMNKRGAFTIAQDHESSMMFGMPLEAIRIGAAKEVLPLDKIAKKLISLVHRG